MKADEFLEGHGIEYDIVEQDNATKTCDDAAIERGLETFQIVKSLIVEHKDEYYHCLVPGDRKLSEKKFGEHRMVNPEKSKKITGQKSGTVHPFSSTIPHIVDERVLEKELLSHTTGDIYKGIIIEKENFQEALDKADFDYQVKDIVVTEERDIEELEEEGLDRSDAKFVVDKGLRKTFRNLSDKSDPEDALTVLRKLHREEAEFDEGTAKEIIERSENETHMQKLAAEYAEEGSLPEEKDGFEIEETVEEVLQENPKAVNDYKDGKDSALNYLLGQVMQETNGRAEGEEARRLLQEELE